MTGRSIQLWVMRLVLAAMLVMSGALTGLSAWAVEISPTFEAGIQAYRHGAYAQAVGHLNRAVNADPRNTNIHYYLGVCLDRLNRNDEAAKQYQFVLNQGDTDTQVLSYARERLKAIKPDASFFVASATAATPAAAVAQNRIKGAVSKVMVPLKANQNALMVDANLMNDRRQRRAIGTFIIDTGATYTSISQEMADSLGLDLKNAETITITTANGRIEVPRVTIDRLSVNGLEAHNVQATVIQVRPGSSFAGLLGLSFLRQFVLTIDPDAGQLIFQQN